MTPERPPGRPPVRLALAALALAAAFLAVFAVAKLVRPAAPSSSPSPAQVSRVFALPLSGSAVIRRAQAAGVGYEPSGRQIHQHAYVRAVVAGVEVHAPRGLGYVGPGLPLGIHTHDLSGVIHLHRPPGSRPYRLSGLMAVWGVPYAPGVRLGPWTAQDGWTVGACASGRPAPGGNPALTDRADIIVYASPPGAPAGCPPASPANWKALPVSAGASRR